MFNEKQIVASLVFLMYVSILFVIIKVIFCGEIYLKDYFILKKLVEP